MAVTTVGAAVDVWAEIAQNAVREGTPADISGALEATLYVDAALSSTTAHTGTEILVQVSSAASGDADWHTIYAPVVLVGTAVKADFAATEAAGQTVLSVTDPVTANVDNNAKLKFIEDATAANSEIVYQTANGGDAGDTVTVLDGITNAHADTADLWDVDSATVSAVAQRSFPLPRACRVRVIYNNMYDADGSTVFTRARLATLTAAA